jgi:protein SCO1
MTRMIWIPRISSLSFAMLLASAASGQPAPDAMVRAGVTEHPGAALPRDARFTLPDGTGTTLGTFFDGQRPVLLVLAYARCTMLCSLVLRGVADVAREMTLEAGRDYRLLLVSLDARETPDEAARKQATLLAQLGRGPEPARWPYLLGTRTDIDEVAGALGFRYAWDARTEQYAHPAVIFAVTPDGRVARYLHGIQHEPAAVAAALDDARAGRAMSSQAADVLRCFRFDPASRRAGERAQRFLRIGAAVVFALSFAGIALLIAWERRLRRRS